MKRFTKKPKLSELTLREKIGQTIAMQMLRLMGEEGGTAAFLEKNPIGNVWQCGNWCMDAANLSQYTGTTNHDTEYYRKWALDLRNYLRVPPMIGVDPVGPGFASNVVTMTSAASIGATDSEEIAYKYGQMQARSAKSVGAHYLWGTCVDMYSRFCGVGIMRAFSDDPERLKKLSIAMIKGIQSEGVAATGKHFPGADRIEHRDVHYAPMCIHTSLDEWKQNQGAMFQALIDAGVDSFMASHMAFPAVDDRKIRNQYVPAIISRNIITKLLKEEMGFKGVVISDCIDMAALAAAYPNVEDLYVELLNAGVDIIETIKGYDYIDLVEKAVKEGRISESRIDDACQRVLDLKEKYGLFEVPDEFHYDEKHINEISKFNREVAENAITLECDTQNLLPIDASKVKNVAIICSSHRDIAFTALEKMKESFEKRGMKVRLQRRISSYEERDEIVAENDLIIYAGYLMPHAPVGASSFYDDECETFFYAFTKGGEKSIGVSLGSVYVYYDFYSAAETFIHLYNLSAEAMDTFVRAIFGEVDFKGVMQYLPAGPQIN